MIASNNLKMKIWLKILLNILKKIRKIVQKIKKTTQLVKKAISQLME